MGVDVCISFLRQILHIAHADIGAVMFEGCAKLVGWECVVLIPTNRA